MINPNVVKRLSLKKIASSLVEEGITPGNAELSSVSDSEGEEKLVAQNFTKNTGRLGSQDNRIKDSDEGISPKVFWVSLSLILTFCFFVFSILPDKVEKEFEHGKRRHRVDTLASKSCRQLVKSSRFPSPQPC